MPAAALVACAVYLLATKPPQVVSLIVVAVLLVVLVGALVTALRRAPRAGDVAPAPDAELAVPLRVGAGSVVDLQAIPASREVLEHGGTAAEARAAAEAAVRDARQHQPL
jgi:PiT family inorganic phosphate transporter